MDGKINVYSNSIDCSFKKCETINKKELSNLLQTMKFMIWNAEKIQKVKNQGWQRQIKQLILLSKCPVCDGKKSTFFLKKKQIIK